MRSDFELIAQATELFKLREENDCAIGLLYPTPSNIFAYGRPALAVTAKVNPGKIILGKSNDCDFFACIRSMDDSGVSIFGPSESKEKARKRYTAFIEFIKTLEYACPTKEELDAFCKNNGVYSDYW